MKIVERLVFGAFLDLQKIDVLTISTHDWGKSDIRIRTWKKQTTEGFHKQEEI